jgi:hypothetical protein
MKVFTFNLVQTALERIVTVRGIMRQYKINK